MFHGHYFKPKYIRSQIKVKVLEEVHWVTLCQNFVMMKSRHSCLTADFHQIIHISV